MAVSNSEAVLWLPSGSTSAESRSGRIGPIILEAKQTGERSAGNPHAAFDEAGAGNVARPEMACTRRRKSEPTGNTNFGLNRRVSPRPYRSRRLVRMLPSPAPWNDGKPRSRLLYQDCFEDSVLVRRRAHSPAKAVDCAPHRISSATRSRRGGGSL